MLGGSRDDYVRRERRIGKMRAMLALLILSWCLISAAVFLTGFARGEVQGEDLLPAGLLIVAAFCIAVFVFQRGLRAMMRRGKQREAPIFEEVHFFSLRLRRREPRTAPWPEDLIRVIGPERASHSPEQLQEAEASLRELRAQALKRTQKKLKVAATCAVALGLHHALLGLMGIMAIFGLYGGLSSVPPVGILTFWQAIQSAQVLAFWFFGASGASLLTAGIGLLLRREWARQVMHVIVWAYFAFFMLGAVNSVARTALVDESETARFLALLWWLVGLTVLGLVVWRIAKFLGSPEVRQLCSRRQ